MKYRDSQSFIAFQVQALRARDCLNADFAEEKTVAVPQTFLLALGYSTLASYVALPPAFLQSYADCLLISPWMACMKKMQEQFSFFCLITLIIA